MHVSVFTLIPCAPATVAGEGEEGDEEALMVKVCEVLKWICGAVRRGGEDRREKD